MEKNGWLDAALLAVLGFLNNPWLGVIVPMGGGLAIGYLARRSPQREWDYIKDVPGKVLAAAFLLLASIKSVPRLIVPTTSLVCDREPGPLGTSVETNCRLATSGTIHTVVDYTFGDYLRDFVLSFVQENVLAFIGGLIGIALAAVVTRRSLRVRR